MRGAVGVGVILRILHDPKCLALGILLVAEDMQVFGSTSKTGVFTKP